MYPRCAPPRHRFNCSAGGVWPRRCGWRLCHPALHLTVRCVASAPPAAGCWGQPLVGPARAAHGTAASAAVCAGRPALGSTPGFGLNSWQQLRLLLLNDFSTTSPLNDLTAGTRRWPAGCQAPSLWSFPACGTSPAGLRRSPGTAPLRSQSCGSHTCWSHRRRHTQRRARARGERH